ncbi:PREDICTED: cation/H(+) antiporter 8 [Tarenaya hassleriana]|uniref:cation/H(+) antiporter 8 n=1 Tax=Tarenaya hassleriana TaxID=28532 RepID=UPI00053C5B9B|nr:PREDICTED: cation/H(+) antiporter 8 [Tarenaya hassleriana]
MSEKLLWSAEKSFSWFLESHPDFVLLFPALPQSCSSSICLGFFFLRTAMSDLEVDLSNGNETEMSRWAFEMAWYGEAVSATGIICEDHPTKLYSSGVWEKMIYGPIGLPFWQYRLPNIELVIVIVFFLWQFFDILFKKLGLVIPKFTSMMLAGLVLHGTMNRTGSVTLHQILQPKHRINMPESLGSLGFTIFWFVKGVKMDIKRIFRSEAKAVTTGIVSVTAPALIGAFLYLRQENRPLQTAVFSTVLLMQSTTPFSGVARLLRDIGINHSSIGRIGLSSSLVSDMLGLVYIFLSIPLYSDKLMAMLIMTMVIVFIVFAFLFVRPAMFRAIKKKREGRPIDNKYIYWILVMLCFSCLYFKMLGQLPALGPFILGLSIPNGPPIGSVLVERLEGFNLGIILPLFFATSMMKIDLGSVKYLFTDAEELAIASLILLIFFVKFLSSAVVPYLFKMPLKDSIVLSLIMSHKGIIELGFYTFAYDSTAIPSKSFTVLALSIVLNSLFIPMAIQYFYDPTKQFMCYQKRNLVNLRDNGELKTLVCIHRPDHITSMINLLEASYHCEGSPLTCYVLHLVELQGQDVPTLISHKVQKLGVGNGDNRSDNVVLSFEHFHRYICSSISIDTFTCIANPNHMQDDICWLALDKAASLILLPFHRTWSLDRKTIISDNGVIRYLNFNVLKQAPCSVGILIERQVVNKNQKKSHSALKVCVIFIGGRDDREALAFAKRMGRNDNVILTVLRLFPTNKSNEMTGWDQMLDTVELREMMHRNSGGKSDESTTYVEKEVLDGTETSMLLRSMTCDFDLFIVGRSNGMDHEVTSGLEGWSEFEELGILGDFLASPDFPGMTSVLVIQQQRSVAS